VFYHAALKRTVFEGADLREADFRDADLEGAKFAGAMLAGAKFQDAKNVPGDISTLTGDDGTVPITCERSRWLKRLRSARPGTVSQ
jgi:uncharacterized protein YjbI with pentapeptide repeats